MRGPAGCVTTAMTSRTRRPCASSIASGWSRCSSRGPRASETTVSGSSGSAVRSSGWAASCGSSATVAASGMATRPSATRRRTIAGSRGCSRRSWHRSTGATRPAPRRPTSTTFDGWRSSWSTRTQRPAPARRSRSRTARESQAPSPAVPRRLGGLRVPGDPHRGGEAARRRGPNGLDVPADPLPLWCGVRLQYGGLVAHHGRRAESPAVLAYLRDHHRRVRAQLRDAHGQRRRRAVQDRGRVALARCAPRGRVGRDLPDAAYAGHVVELPDGHRARRAAAAAACGAARRPGRGVHGAGRPVLAPVDRTPPGRAGAGPGRSEEHTSELQSLTNLVCRLLLAKKNSNRDQRMLVIDKLRETVDGLHDKVVALLGLAFKPNTDDLREAPSLDITSVLLAAGAQVR